MLEIDYGLAGSGKSRYIKDIFWSKIDSDEKLMILVPDQYSFITERSVLEDFGARLGSRIKVIWFNELARDITEKYGGVKAKLLDNSGKAVLMSKAVKELSDKLDFYKNQASKPDFISSILNLTSEIKYSKTDIDSLIQAGSDSGSSVLAKKLEEISLIIKKYDELVGESYLNPDDMLAKVNEILEKESYFEGCTVAVDGFGFFDKQKLDIIGKIIKQSKQTYITLCTDSLEMSENEAEKFAAVKKTAQNIISVAQENGVKVNTKKFDDLSALLPEFRALSRSVYSPDCFTFDDKSENIELASSDNIERECDFAALEIKKLIMQKNYRYKDIAVIVRDEEKYLPYLKRSFSALGIPFFKDARRSVSNEPLMLFCHFALKAAADNFRTDDVMACIKSAAVGIETNDISDFENYCIIWNISGKKKWSRDFSYNPEGFTDRFTKDDEQKLKKINELRKRIIIPLLSFAKSVKGADVEQISAALYELLIKVNAPENLKRLSQNIKESTDIAYEQSTVWDTLMSCLDQLVATRGSEIIPLREYMNILDLALSNSNIGVVPQKIDEIMVGSAERIRTDLPKAAFLLGVNEGEFPKGYTDSGILTDFERMSLIKYGIELGINCRSMSSQERFFAYCAALAPSEFLFISYKKSNFEGDILAPSSLVSEVLKAVPNVIQRDSSVLTADDVLTPSQGFGVMARLWEEDTALRQTLYEIYSESEDFGAKTAMIENRSQKSEKSISNPDTALELFGSVMAISPTQLETYSKCPFMYFCKYGLNAKPIEKAQLDARTGGTLIHFVLENLVRDKGKSGIVEMSLKQLKEQADKYISLYLEQLNLPEEFVSGRFSYIVSKNRQIIISTLEQMRAEMSQSDFEPADFELKVGKFGAGGYEVELEKGKVSLMGTVDRVDLMKNGDNKYFRIIDYKTGPKEFKLGEVLHGINAQMLIYLLSLSTDKGEKYGGSVPAGLLYINAKDKPISAERGDSDDIEKQRNGRYKMSGMLLGEDEVIYGMENEPCGKFLPITVSKAGKISGNLVTREQMELLRQKMDSVISLMGNNLHQGKIDDMPSVTGTSSACDYCDYKAVCRNTLKEQKLNIPRFGEALNELERGEGNE